MSSFRTHTQPPPRLWCDVGDEHGTMILAEFPKTTVMAAVPAATGDGRMVFPQLDLQRRVVPSKPNYDPVAERVVLNLLGRESYKPKGIRT